MAGADSPLPIRALIVHCPGDPRRERNVQKQLAYYREVGLLSVEVFDGIRPSTPGPFATKGEYGSYQSQLACLDLVADDPAVAAVLLIEDDAVPRLSVDEFREQLRCALSIPDWDTFHLGFATHAQLRGWDPQLTKPGYWRVRGNLLGCLCYLVRRTSIEPMTTFMRELAVRDPLLGGGVGWDGALCVYTWERDIVRLATVDSIVEQMFGLASTHRRYSFSHLAADRVLGLALAVGRSRRPAPRCIDPALLGSGRSGTGWEVDGRGSDPDAEPSSGSLAASCVGPDAAL